MASAVDVAVAVLIRANGKVLLAQRPKGKVFAGYWEFPGGKVEPGEPILSALERELMEELGIRVERAFPWIVREFAYPHATVRLHFFRVVAWRGEPRAVEHQAMRWEHPAKVGVDPMLPANGPVLKSLQLPEEYAITQAEELGTDTLLARLEHRLAAGLRLVQVREKTFDRDGLAKFARDVVKLAKPAGARVIVNADVELARLVGADGVHLTAGELAAAKYRPELPWCGASCHSEADLRKAEQLGVDFAVLGPVLETTTHPDAFPLGWDVFESLAAEAAIPVFALGGMTPVLLDIARIRGAHGLAMRRGSWTL